MTTSTFLSGITHLVLFSDFWFLNLPMLLKRWAKSFHFWKQICCFLITHFPLPRKKQKTNPQPMLTVSFLECVKCLFLVSVSITQKYTQGVTTLHIYPHAWCSTTITIYPLKLAMNHTEMLYMYRLIDYWGNFMSHGVRLRD